MERKEGLNGCLAVVERFEGLYPISILLWQLTPRS